MLETDAKALVSGAGGAGIVVGVGSIGDLAQWAAPAAAAAGGLVVQSATQFVRAAAGTRQAARTHDLYYLLAANDRLR